MQKEIVNLENIKSFFNFKTNNSFLIIGDIMVDCYYFGIRKRKSAETNLKIFDQTKERLKMGGAGNLFFNLKELGNNVEICGSVGNDNLGDFAKKQIKNLTYIVLSKRTTKKCRFYEGNRQIFRWDDETIIKCNKSKYNNLISLIKNNISKYSAIFFSDYNKGFCNNEFVREVIKLAKRNNIKVFVDTKDSNTNKYEGVFLLKLNAKEFYSYFKFQFDEYNLQKVISFLQEKNIENLLVTLGSKGMCLVNKNGKYYFQKAIELKSPDVIGAGDCVDSVFATSLLRGLNIKDALALSAFCAYLSICLLGTNALNLEYIRKEIYE